MRWGGSSTWNRFRCVVCDRVWWAQSPKSWCCKSQWLPVFDTLKFSKMVERKDEIPEQIRML